MPFPVSIGMPVYNGEKYLKDALESMVNQTFGDFELIISDNASTDSTEEICREFAARDDRIRYYRQQTNRGAAWNFNNVFKLSAGKFFKWSCHDDMYEPTLLERSFERLKSAPFDVVLCYAKTRLIDNEGCVVADYEDNAEVQQNEPSRRLRHLLKVLNLCNITFGLMRADAVQTTRLLGNYNSSDHVFLAELALRGKFVEIPEPLFLRRRHSESSIAANVSLEKRAMWFDPANAGKTQNHFLITRLLIEHLNAVRYAPMTLTEKLRCYGIVMSHWLPKWKGMAGDCRRAARYLVHKRLQTSRRTTDCHSH